MTFRKLIVGSSSSACERDSLDSFKPSQFEHLVSMEHSREVLSEVDHILMLMFPDYDTRPVHRVFQDVVKLFEGGWPGYQKCNTQYHDLHHTMDCFLAMARLVHGGSVDGIRFGRHNTYLSLISSLMHDTGYIQPADDRTGTGAKYTLVHIERSIGFLERYLAQNGFAAEDLNQCRNCLRCTGLDVNVDQIQFSSRENEVLGKMLGTADLLGQMASPAYLERLPELLSEFIEGGVPGFGDEVGFLEQTIKFWEMTQRRFRKDLGGVNTLMRNHFRVRWGIDRDLYWEAIERHIHYLDYILENYREDYRDYLTRNGWMKLLDN